MEPTPEQLAAGEPHGLPPELCARLQGETAEELAADAAALVAEFAPPPSPPPPAPRVGGPRGRDVGSGGGRGTVGAGAAAYRAKHGLDDEGKRPERKPATSNNNPLQERTYSFDR